MPSFLVSSLLWFIGCWQQSLSKTARQLTYSVYGRDRYAHIYKMEMTASGTTTSLSTGDTTVFNDPGIGTDVTITITYDWDASATTQCTGCIIQFYFGVDDGDAPNDCNSYGGTTTRSGQTVSMSYTSDGYVRNINVGITAFYGCGDIPNAIPRHNIGYIDGVPNPTTFPTLDPTMDPTMDPTAQPTKQALFTYVMDDAITDYTEWKVTSGGMSDTFTSGPDANCPFTGDFCWKASGAFTVEHIAVDTANYSDITLAYQMSSTSANQDTCSIQYKIGTSAAYQSVADLTTTSGGISGVFSAWDPPLNRTNSLIYIALTGTSKGGAQTCYFNQLGLRGVALNTAVPTPYPSIHPTATPIDNPTKGPWYNPSATPTDHPSRAPTDHPTAATGNPSAAPTDDPSAAPTDDPTTATGNPSDAPTEDPTTSISPTDHPTMVPSETPSDHPVDAAITSEPISANYTIYIGLNCEDDTECNVDTEALKAHILIAIQAKVDIYRTEIRNDAVVLIVSITATSHQELQTDRIMKDIEREIKDEDQFGDVEVQTADDESIESKDAQTPLEWALSYLAMHPLKSGLILILSLFCCIIVCVICCKKRKKRNMLKDPEALEKYQTSGVTSDSGTNGRTTDTNDIGTRGSMQGATPKQDEVIAESRGRRHSAQTIEMEAAAENRKTTDDDYVNEDATDSETENDSMYERVQPRDSELIYGTTAGVDTAGGDTAGGDTAGGDTAGGDTAGGDTAGGEHQTAGHD